MIDPAPSALGHEIDARDAGAIVGIFKVARRHSAGSSVLEVQVRRLLRQAVDQLWDKPRETKQGRRKRMPQSLWSPAAFAAAEEANATIGEHVFPISIRIDCWWQGVDELTVDTVLADLAQDPWAVITTEEDRALRRKGLSSKMPDNWEVGHSLWARYDEVDMLKERSEWRTYSDWTAMGPG